MVKHSQFQMPNTKWGGSILCRSKMADLVPLKFAHKINLLSPSIHIYRFRHEFQLMCSFVFVRCMFW